MPITITDPAVAAAELAARVEKHERIVFFGGAGVSTASGIPDFRSVDGLYHQKFDYPPETMLSHDFFETHTGEFYEFYRTKMIALGAKPNQAHLKLAELERAGKLTAVITQNIPIKPDVVLYGEGLDNQVIHDSVRAIEEADMLIVGGTSLVVYPAAGLVDYFGGAELVVVNRDPIPVSSRAGLIVQADIAQAFDF